MNYALFISDFYEQSALYMKDNQPWFYYPDIFSCFIQEMWQLILYTITSSNQQYYIYRVIMEQSIWTY